MSLRVWLPLNGDLHNQGCSNVTVTNNGATVNTNGKIGQCYSFDGVDDYLQFTNFNPSGLGELSIACWIYPTATFEYLFIIRNNAPTHQFRLNSNGVGFRDTGHSDMATVALGTTIPINTWTHLACTYRHGAIDIFVNGKCTASAHGTNYYNSSNVLNNNLNEIRLGRQQSSSGNVYYTGRINDFRIYDHCLSAAEVHEISQGLVLHYKLDSFNNNLFKLTPQGYHPTDYCGYNLGLETNLVGGQQYTVQFWDVTISHSGKTNTQLNLQLYWGGGNNWLVTFANSNFTNGHADYLKATFTAPTSPSNATEAQNAWINVYNSPSYASGTLNMHIGAWKIEKGSIGTQWSGNDNIIQDSSGYNHNGTITGNITLNSSTPRYSASSLFNGTERITTTTPGADIRTLSCWCKTTKNKSTSQQMVADSFSNMTISFYNGTIIGVFGTTRGTGSKCTLGDSYKENDWNHIVVVKTDDAGARDIYCNGVKLTPASNDYWSAATGFFVGARNTSNGNPFYGQISDVRAYCTALSADDILSLYHTAAKVDNLHNIHTFEYIENSYNIKLTKQGQLKEGEIQETTATKFYKTSQVVATKQAIEF